MVAATIGGDNITDYTIGVNTTYYYYITSVNLQREESIASDTVAVTCYEQPQSEFYARQTTTAPVIDGNIDTLWSAAPAYDIENTVVGSTSGQSDLSASWKALWDNNYLYLLIDVTDDQLQAALDPSGYWWEDDCIELFFDMAADGYEHMYDPDSHYDMDDFQFGLRWNDPGNVHVGIHPGNPDTAGFQFHMISTGSGYRVEAALAWSGMNVTPTAGQVIGFDVGVDDDDTGFRESQTMWNCHDEFAFQYPNRFGRIELSGSTATEPEIQSTDSAPTIDGNVDTLWAAANTYSIDNLVLGSVNNPDDLSATWKALWDSNNLYLLVDINDNLLQAAHSGDWWEDDVIELFLDLAADGYSSGELVTADDADDAINYTGSWNPQTGWSGRINETVHETDSSGATATFSFNGSSVSLIGDLQPYGGNAEIFIDSVSQGTYSFNGETAYQQVIYNNDSLADTTHTFTVVCQGGGWTYIDAITYEGGDSAYDMDDYQFGFRWNDPGNVIVGTHPSTPDTSGFQFQMISTASGYRYEAALPWAGLNHSPATDQIIGFDIGIDDDDTGLRDAQMMWNSPDEFAFMYPNRFGRARLVNTTPPPPPDDPYATYTTTSPTIDGSQESLWNSAPAYDITKVVTGSVGGSSDLSATWQGLWDQNNLYLMINITDQYLQNNLDPTEWWQDDVVEIFFDMDADAGSSYDEHDFQIAFRWNDPAVIEGTHPVSEPYLDTAGVQFQRQSTGTGYRLEAKLPWSGLHSFSPTADVEIGFDIGIDDDDGSLRESQTMWNTPHDQAYATPADFGRVILYNPAAPEAPPITQNTGKPHDSALITSPVEHATTAATGQYLKKQLVKRKLINNWLTKKAAFIKLNQLKHNNLLNIDQQDEHLTLF